MPVVLIDAHAHVFAKVSGEFPRQVTDTTPADREATAEQLLERMAATGVEKANLIQIGGQGVGHLRYLLRCLRTYPEHFRGIGLIVDHQHPEEQMDRLAGDGGIIGFRLFDIGGPRDPLAPMDVRTFETYPVWRHAAEKDYVIWLYPQAAENHCVPFMLQAFPEMTVVYNHLAFCPGDGTFGRDEAGRSQIDLPIPPQTRYNTMGLHQYPNVCVMLSGQYAFSKEAYPYKDLSQWHGNLLRTFQADHLMWGTDSPWIVQDPGYDELVRVIDAQLPESKAQDRALIMGGTAQARLFSR